MLNSVFFINVVALKCSQNHFISEKYKKVQSFKLHFLQYNPLVRLYTSASDCKIVGNIPGRHFLNVFQLFRDILNDASSIAKALSLQC